MILTQFLMKFSLFKGMYIPQFGDIGTGQFLHLSLKAHNIWHSSRGENKFPHSRLRRSWGNLSSPLLLRHILCAFRDSWGNFFSSSRGFATRGGKSRPYFSTLRD